MMQEMARIRLAPQEREATLLQSGGTRTIKMGKMGALVQHVRMAHQPRPPQPHLLHHPRQSRLLRSHRRQKNAGVPIPAYNLRSLMVPGRIGPIAVNLQHAILFFTILQYLMARQYNL
jgi:hypothetical protein